jgi:hypothetical protein
MNLLAKFAPVMMAMCCVLILGIIASFAIWLTNFHNEEAVNRVIYSGIDFIYLIEMAFISTVLWVKKDNVPALSYYFYLFIVLLRIVFSVFMPVNVTMLQVLSVLTLLCMINLIVQSYSLQPKQLSKGYLVFAWTLLIEHFIYIAYPFYAASHYLSIDSYRVLALVNIITYLTLLYTLIVISRHFDTEQREKYINAFSNDKNDPYSKR